MKKSEAHVVIKPYPFSAEEIEGRFLRYQDNPLMLEISEIIKKYSTNQPAGFVSKKIVQSKQEKKNKEKGKTIDVKMEEAKEKKAELFQKKLLNISHLLTLPDHVLKIKEMLDSHRSSVEDIANEISKDPALTAEILKIANSGFYGFTHRIADIQQAIVMLGFAVVHAIVISASVINLRDAKKLWEHSVACARVAMIIARQKKIHHAEEIAIAGLLHDLGRLVLMEYFKEDYQKILQLVVQENISGLEAEKALLGFTHSDIGGWLLNRWNLPLWIVETITFHHHPENASRFQERAAIVCLADLLVNALGIRTLENAPLPEITREELTSLKLTNNEIDLIVEKFVNALEC